MHNASN